MVMLSTLLLAASVLRLYYTSVWACSMTCLRKCICELHAAGQLPIQSTLQGVQTVEHKIRQ